MSVTKIIINGQKYSLGGGGGTDFTTDDTLVMSEDNVLSVKMPVKGPITKEAYDKLSEEEKENVYIVKDSEWTPIIVEIQEYDTQSSDGTDWHVRKWSNGFCELFGHKVYSKLNVTNPRGSSGLYISDNLSAINYPITFLQVYNVNLYIESRAVGTNVMAFRSSATWTGVYDTKKLQYLSIETATSSAELDAIVSFHITGRWK